MARKKETDIKTKKKDEEVKETRKKQKCNMCGSNLALSNFYKSKARIYAGNDETMCYCKKCINNEYLSFLEQVSGNESLAIKMTCCEFSIPFNNSFCDGAIREAKKKRSVENNNSEEESVEEISAFKLYVKNVNSLSKSNGFNESGFDYLSHLQITEDECMSADIFNEKARQLKVTTEMIEFWDGVKDKKKLYILEKIWNEYSNSYKITNPVHVKLFKECAFLELDSIERRNKSINNDVSENTKKITELLNSLKLLPKNNKGDGDNADSCDGILIKSIENQHPIANKEWGDKKELMKFFDLMRGHMNKNLGIKESNPYYEKVMTELAIENTPVVSSADNGGENDA